MTYTNSETTPEDAMWIAHGRLTARPMRPKSPTGSAMACSGELRRGKLVVCFLVDGRVGNGTRGRDDSEEKSGALGQDCARGGAGAFT